MAAISNRLLHVRRNLHSYPCRTHSYPLRHFSSSSNSSDIPQPGGEQDSAEARPPPFSAYFNDVKSSLRKESTPQNRQQSGRKPFSFSDRAPPKTASLEEIRRNLSAFRLRAAPPPPPSSGEYVSMQELYNRNVVPQSGGDSAAASSDAKPYAAGSPPSLNAIRETLRRLKSTAPAAGSQADSTGKPADHRLSFAQFKENLKLKSDANAGVGSTTVVGGSGSFHPAFFGKESLGGWGLSYGYEDLGEKLKSLRPAKRKGKWFSLQELNDRLAKLREIENKKSEEGLGVAVRDIRDSLKKMSKSKDEKARQGTIQRLGILGTGIGTPSFMLSPPQEHLVEKFFHPDNMSSAEKLKLELKKVRDEFKISESDCGSARVQVAQLTTKIKHLSTVLAKKDKHSRRGLQAMVQRRKRLLKYLRQTDWDSYCLVLSKLGLRDNPDLKA